MSGRGQAHRDPGIANRDAGIAQNTSIADAPASLLRHYLAVAEEKERSQAEIQRRQDAAWPHEIPQSAIRTWRQDQEFGIGRLPPSPHQSMLLVEIAKDWTYKELEDKALAAWPRDLIEPEGRAVLDSITGGEEGRRLLKSFQDSDPLFKINPHIGFLQNAVLSSAFHHYRRLPDAKRWNVHEQRNYRGGIAETAVAHGYQFALQNDLINHIPEGLAIPPPIVLAYAWRRLRPFSRRTKVKITLYRISEMAKIQRRVKNNLGYEIDWLSRSENINIRNGYADIPDCVFFADSLNTLPFSTQQAMNELRSAVYHEYYESGESMISPDKARVTCK